MPRSNSALRRQSPYQRYQKSPFQYSAEYQEWRAAVRRGDKAMAWYWAGKHAAKFGLVQQQATG